MRWESIVCPSITLTEFRKRLICSSVQLLKTIFHTNYIGDSDSSTFNTIEESKPYGDIIITKFECVGHVQKRLGTRFRKLPVTWKGKNYPMVKASWVQAA